MRGRVAVSCEMCRGGEALCFAIYPMRVRGLVGSEGLRVSASMLLSVESAGWVGGGLEGRRLSGAGVFIVIPSTVTRLLCRIHVCWTMRYSFLT